MAPAPKFENSDEWTLLVREREQRHTWNSGAESFIGAAIVSSSIARSFSSCLGIRRELKVAGTLTSATVIGVAVGTIWKKEGN